MTATTGLSANVCARPKRARVCSSVSLANDSPCARGLQREIHRMDLVTKQWGSSGQIQLTDEKKT